MRTEAFRTPTDDDELVLTTRRATLRSSGRSPRAVRLRLTDRRLVLTGADGARLLDVGLEAVRPASRLRAGIVVATSDGTARVRCFGAAGVLGLALLTRPASAGQQGEPSTSA